ncbi:MarR family winged helix-turn-helix transcriptional regulator [Aestuariispira insulae]|uniref:MarR family protein n=1 Tax=Aestuariispira insulae TaxID=1461337 RepID=A0A3D9H9L4_9PROT|nr:MarR family transcriptional regulator [Aestuariispira insulae]RED46190.1 MarR family protein [Aestuariispira insulae]
MAKKNLIIDSDMPLDQKALVLLLCTAQEQQMEMTRIIQDLNLSLAQLQMLHSLAQVPNGTLTVNQLKDFMVNDASNVSRALNKLVEAGYVTKERSTTDQRTVMVTITKDGHAAHEEADRRLIKHRLPLSAAETETLYGLLAKL